MAEPNNELFIETRRLGAILRITAIDPDTGTEVTFQTPANTGAEHIALLAANKMRYVLEKKDKC